MASMIIVSIELFFENFRGNNAKFSIKSQIDEMGGLDTVVKSYIIPENSQIFWGRLPKGSYLIFVTKATRILA